MFSQNLALFTDLIQHCPSSFFGHFIQFLVHPYGEPHHMWSALKHYCVLRGCIALPCRLKSLSHVVSLSVILWDGFLYSVSTHTKSLHHTQHRLAKPWIHSNTLCLVHQSSHTNTDHNKEQTAVKPKWSKKKSWMADVAAVERRCLAVHGKF